METIQETLKPHPVLTPDEINAKFSLVSQQYNLLLSLLSTIPAPSEVLQVAIQDFFKAFCVVKEAFNIMMFQTRENSKPPVVDPVVAPVVEPVVGNDAE